MQAQWTWDRQVPCAALASREQDGGVTALIAVDDDAPGRIIAQDADQRAIGRHEDQADVVAREDVAPARLEPGRR